MNFDKRSYVQKLNFGKYVKKFISYFLLKIPYEKSKKKTQIRLKKKENLSKSDTFVRTKSPKKSFLLKKTLFSCCCCNSTSPYITRWLKEHT